MRRVPSVLAMLAAIALAVSPSASASQGFPVAGLVLDSANGQPLAGFTVTLTPDKGGAGQTTHTSANGKFSFASVAVGKYILSGSGPGYRAQGLNQHESYFTGVAVGPELDATSIVFRMQADASIRGQVIDEQSEPIRNATAQLFRIEETNGLRRAESLSNAGTNDQGIYHFSHLSPGTYYVAISARPWYAQYAPQSVRGAQQQLDSETSTRLQQETAEFDVAYPLTFYPGADDSSQATAITLRAGERSTADITMRAVPTAHLKIRSDRFLQGPPPTVMQRVFDGLLIPIFASTGYGYGQNVYEFGGLAPGHYAVEFTGGASEKSGNKTGWFRDVDLYGDMEISASDSPSMATITGLVQYEGPPPPRQEAYLELRNEESGDSWSGKISEKGLFGLQENDLRPGTYQAAIYGAPDWIITKIIAQNGVVKGTEITLTAGAAAKLVCTVTRVSASLSGAVMRDDKPLAGAMVLLVPDDGGADKQRYRRDESDSDGTFTLRQVVPGRYTAVAIQNGWNLEWGNPDVLKPYLAKGEKLTVAAEKNGNLKLQAQ